MYSAVVGPGLKKQAHCRNLTMARCRTQSCHPILPTDGINLVFLEAHTSRRNLDPSSLPQIPEHRLSLQGHSMSEGIVVLQA